MQEAGEISAMKSTQLLAVEKVAQEIDASLRADDSRFLGNVRVKMEDSSYFYWNNAFHEKHLVDDHQWLFVFTEHYEFHVFDINDVRDLSWSSGPMPVE